MRAFTVVAFCLAAIAARAQSWELGSAEAGPAPYSRRTLNAAASVHGHLVTWNENYGSLFAARTSTEGEVLDPAALHIGYGGFDLGALVASDGEDYLVAWNTEVEGPRTVRVTADGLLVPNDWKPGGRLLALASNGRNYLLLYYSWGSSSPEAVLLNRNGVPVSGTLRLPQTDGHSLAARKGKWLLACGRPETAETLLAELSESDFPPYAQSRSFELQSLLPPGSKSGRPRIAAGPRGFVLVSSRSIRSHDEIEVEWHEDGGLRGVERDLPREGTRIERPTTVVWPSAPLFIEELQVAMDGPVVYVTYRTDYETGTIRFEGSRAEEVVLPKRTEAEVSVASLGAAAFWIDPGDEQVYTSRIASAVATLGEPRHVSRSFPIQYASTLVSGGGVHLALWQEFGRGFRRLTSVVLSNDGAPLTPPVVLGERASWFLAVWNGDEFFVMWDDPGLSGCIVASDGTIREGPFEILPESYYSYWVDSLVWDGTTYVFSMDSEVTRLSRDGKLVERKYLYETYGYRMRLHPVDGGFLAILDATYKIGCQCGFSGKMRTLVLDRDFERDDSRREVWRDRAWEWWSWTGLAEAAVSPSGHRLLVRDEAWGDEGFRVAGDDGEFRFVPYGGPLSSVIWDGQEFLVAAGDRLARHAPDGQFRGLLPLPPKTYASAVAVDRNRVPIVLMERAVGGRRRLLLTRLQTASSESGPSPR